MTLQFVDNFRCILSIGITEVVTKLVFIGRNINPLNTLNGEPGIAKERRKLLPARQLLGAVCDMNIDAIGIELAFAALLNLRRLNRLLNFTH